MKTNTWLLLLLLAIAGGSRSFAQAYSINAVGYVTMSLAPGEFRIISNPLNMVTNGVQNNILDAILPNVANTTRLYRFDPAVQRFSSSFTRRATGWTPFGATTVINPGEGFFVQNPSRTNITLTFVGEVPQGNLTVPLVPGCNLAASPVPLAGLVETDLKLPVANGERLYLFRNGVYLSYTRRASGWTPSEPFVEVGEGFYFLSFSKKVWTVSFFTNL